jgi:hypothetical protein
VHSFQGNIIPIFKSRIAIAKFAPLDLFVLLHLHFSISLLTSEAHNITSNKICLETCLISDLSQGLFHFTTACLASPEQCSKVFSLHFSSDMSSDPFAGLLDLYKTRSSTPRSVTEQRSFVCLSKGQLTISSDLFC